uniref:Uncharacterized protein n=1 Tax=Triticum urartu TaxID=4572 RepID=A0A8R7Q2U6_TRIUA
RSLPPSSPLSAPSSPPTRFTTSALQQPIPIARVSAPTRHRPILFVSCHLLDGASGIGPCEADLPQDVLMGAPCSGMFGMSASPTALSRPTMAAANTSAPRL